MEDLQKTLRSLRQLCTRNRIHALSMLEAFVHIDPSITQAEIAKRSRQSKSAIGAWIDLYELCGLITRDKGNKKERSISYTPDGIRLISDLSAIFRLAPS